MKHKHFKEMTEYAIDAQKTDKPWELWECNYNGQGWQSLFGEAIWALNTDYRRIDPYRELKEYYRELKEYYRRIDPYRELKEAQERGETIQTRDGSGGWFDVIKGFAVYDAIERGDALPYPVEDYRIKPKTKKLYLWAVNSNGSWSVHSWMCETVDEVQQAYNKDVVNEFKRLDSTIIEVEA
jgi:hypothetical protein